MDTVFEDSETEGAAHIGNVGDDDRTASGVRALAMARQPSRRFVRKPSRRFTDAVAAKVLEARNDAARKEGERKDTDESEDSSKRQSTGTLPARARFKVAAHALRAFLARPRSLAPGDTRDKPPIIKEDPHSFLGGGDSPTGSPRAGGSGAAPPPRAPRVSEALLEAGRAISQKMVRSGDSTNFSGVPGLVDALDLSYLESHGMTLMAAYATRREVAMLKHLQNTCKMRGLALDLLEVISQEEFEGGTDRNAVVSETAPLHQAIVRRLEEITLNPNERVLNSFVSRASLARERGGMLGMLDHTREHVLELAHWLLDALLGDDEVTQENSVQVHFMDAITMRAGARPLWTATFDVPSQGHLAFHLSNSDPEICVEGLLHCFFKCQGFSHEQCLILERLGAPNNEEVDLAARVRCVNSPPCRS